MFNNPSIIKGCLSSCCYLCTCMFFPLGPYCIHSFNEHKLHVWKWYIVHIVATSAKFIIPLSPFPRYTPMHDRDISVPPSPVKHSMSVHYQQALCVRVHMHSLGAKRRAVCRNMFLRSTLIPHCSVLAHCSGDTKYT